MQQARPLRAVPAVFRFIYVETILKDCQQGADASLRDGTAELGIGPENRAGCGMIFTEVCGYGCFVKKTFNKKGK